MWTMLLLAEVAADGSVNFYGSPKGAAPVAFRMTQSSADETVFVNPSHDYPQRIRYRRLATGIDAEISLADGSRPNRWTYQPMGAPPAP